MDNVNVIEVKDVNLIIGKEHILHDISVSLEKVLFVNLFDADLFNLFGSINLHFSQISQ